MTRLSAVVAGLLLSALHPACGGNPSPCPGPGCPPTPTPTPTPAPPREPPVWDGEKFTPKAHGPAFCCCPWEEPGNEECQLSNPGVEEGWSAATPEAIRRVDEESGGTANVLLIRNAPVKLDHPTYSTHDELVTACETATRLGWLTIISADGTWAARRPPDHPDGDRYGRRLSDFRNRAAPAAVVSDVEALARKAFEAECHAVWEISNESFLAGRGVTESQIQAFDERRLDISQLPRIAVSSQPELREYENSIGAAIKRGFPGAVLGSNSGASADFVAWISAHGNPDERLAPDCEPGWDCALTETDNRVYSQETWLRWIETFREQGALLVIWRGPNTVESMTRVFRAMGERYPPRPR